MPVKLYYRNAQGQTVESAVLESHEAESLIIDSRVQVPVYHPQTRELIGFNAVDRKWDYHVVEGMYIALAMPSAPWVHDKNVVPRKFGVRKERT